MTGSDDPVIIPDQGAGAWNSKPKTYSAVALKLAIEAGLGPITMSTIGLNATRHMAHYLGNSGLDLKIDLENMVRTVPSARIAMILEFRQAQRFLQSLPAGRYDFTSKKEQGGYNEQGESRDWFFAIGGYALWGKGRARIEGAGPTRRYDVDFIYKVADRYNWDGGKQVEIGGITITDEFMGEFHRQGLAKEFNCHGSLRRRFQWSGDSTVPPDAMILRGGGR